MLTKITAEWSMFHDAYIRRAELTTAYVNADGPHEYRLRLRIFSNAGRTLIGNIALNPRMTWDEAREDAEFLHEIYETALAQERTE